MPENVQELLAGGLPPMTDLTQSSTVVCHDAASFEKAWQVASLVPGWLTETEAHHLYRSALNVPLQHCVVAIGPFQGRSCTLLAHSGRTIVLVDSMEIGDDPINRVTIKEDDVTALQCQLQKYPNVNWIRSRVKACPISEQQIGLLLIDGDHSYPRPREDFEHFRGALTSGAMVAFHDYCTFDGVTASISDLRANGQIENGIAADSMYIAKVRDFNQIKTEIVTGFHLIALCHRFGRRGRSFASSLACQESNPYPIHLTVFFNEPIDASLILQGCVHGPHPPAVTFRHIPMEGIMQRAVHFASEPTSPQCSHVVYLDADLWFPPDFWASYGNELSKAPRGYWSCLVRQIPIQSSEELLVDWQSISEPKLSAVASGVRHDDFQGRVGHFQCIPSGLTSYPLDWIQAVNRADETFAQHAIELSLDPRPERRICHRSAFHFDHPRCWSGSTTLL